MPDVPVAASASRLNLLPEDRRPAAGSWRRWQVLAPIGLLAAIALVGLTLPILAEARIRDRARSPGGHGPRAGRGLGRCFAPSSSDCTGEYNFALERKYAFPPTVQVLDEITKLLPDDTWLTQMELKTSSRGKEAQRELMLRGESGNAGRLITLFEESKVFAQAAPRSPTTKIQPGPGEIFDLVAQLRPLPAPAPVTVAQAAAEPAESATGAARPAADPAVPTAEPAVPTASPRCRKSSPRCRKSSPSPKAPPPLRRQPRPHR